MAATHDPSLSADSWHHPEVRHGLLADNVGTPDIRADMLANQKQRQNNDGWWRPTIVTQQYRLYISTTYTRFDIVGRQWRVVCYGP